MHSRDASPTVRFLECVVKPLHKLISCEIINSNSKMKGGIKMKLKKIYDAEKFDNIRDIMANAVKLYPNNVAFKIKHKNGKEVSYTDITYSEFQKEINEFGAGLMAMGYKDKRVAVIGKNSYPWALTYCTVLGGLGVLVPLDKGLPEAEIELSLKRSKAEVIVFDKEYEEFVKKMDSSSISVREKVI